MTFYAIYNIISKIVFRYRYKNSFRVELFCLQNNVMLKNGEDACDGAYSVNFLNDSEVLDLGSAFIHCLSLRTCALIKQYAKHFHVYWLYTIFYSISVQYCLYTMSMCNVKDTYTKTLFNIIFRFSVCDFTYDYRVNIHDRFSW